MCLQGADPGLWKPPDVVVLVPRKAAPPRPPTRARQVLTLARLLAALPFALASAAALAVGLGLYFAAKRIRGAV